jgi:hypothetical protein
LHPVLEEIKGEHQHGSTVAPGAPSRPAFDWTHKAPWHSRHRAQEVCQSVQVKLAQRMELRGCRGDCGRREAVPCKTAEARRLTTAIWPTWLGSRRA